MLETPRGGIIKDPLHLLERFLTRLREEEEDMNEHGRAKDAEQDVYLPLDVLKGRRDEVSECEVEGPVCGGGESDGFPADAEGVEFGGVDP